MDEGNPKRKAKLKQPDSDDSQGSSANVIPSAPTITPTIPSPIQPPAQAEVPKEVTDELGKLIQDLLLKAHELSFEYSTMECEEILECPLARKAKELFRIIKRLSDIARKMSAPQRSLQVM